MKKLDLSNSQIDLYRACPRKFKRNVIDGVKPIEEPSQALEYGTALHAGLEAIVTGLDGLYVFNSMIKAAKSFVTPRDKAKYLEMGDAHLRKFKKFHLKDFTDIVSEKRLFTTIDGNELAGTPDLVCKYKGKVSVVDFKTSYAAYKRDVIYTLPQMKMYALMLRQFGIPVEQLVYLVFVKSGEYSIQTPLVRSISDEEINQFSEDLSNEIRDISNDKTYRKNPQACHTYGRLCPYAQECFPAIARGEDSDDGEVS